MRAVAIQLLDRLGALSLSKRLDCFVAPLLAMTVQKLRAYPNKGLSCSGGLLPPNDHHPTLDGGHRPPLQKTRLSGIGPLDRL